MAQQREGKQGRQIRLVHWNEQEGRHAASELRSLGYRVAYAPLTPVLLKEMRLRPPAVFVVDLTRLPSQGRDFAVAVRQYKALRQIPIVFAGGDPAKVFRVKQLLPDATYAGWPAIGKAVRRSLSQPRKPAVVPRSRLAGYIGTPLLKKLGAKPGAAVFLSGAPRGFEKVFAETAAGVRFSRRAAARCKLTLWFVKSRRSLVRGIGQMASRALGGGLWIIWPKKASGVASDLSQEVVRRVGLEAGLVDFKIASIDSTWAGLRFTIRRRGGLSR